LGDPGAQGLMGLFRALVAECFRKHSKWLSLATSINRRVLGYSDADFLFKFTIVGCDILD
jgi:hypothetical protein